MDQDRELFKLQVAAQHYESTLDKGYNYLGAFILAVLVLKVSGAFPKELSETESGLVWLGTFIVALFSLWMLLRWYNHKIERLDQYLQNLQRGQPAPSLSELTKE
jgi:hypothetical protein